MSWHEEYESMTLDELEECESELREEYERMGDEEDFDRDERNQCYEEWCYVDDLVCELRDSE